MDAARSLLVLGLMTAGAGVSADLRMASQPDNGYNVQQRGNVKFVSTKAYYMEPSTFNYQGLKDQRDGGAYDNFLRSNIDNEQDKRNFNTEAGRDMLPFRTYEAAQLDVGQSTIKNKLPAGAAGAITATPGVPVTVPLRWNNPHSAELEVNVWIMNNLVVVPVRKPACAGEGHQDAAFAFTIPSDFNTAIPSRVPGFKGCKAVGDCVLQIYAHSVEPRQYAIGTPLIITGDVAAATTGAPQIDPALADPGTDISKQPTDFCLSSESPAADIKNAVPRYARHISDVYNHAYQNSDYSPYSGQQPESISKNLQASVIISMIPANRGELGQALLKKNNAAASAYQAQLAAKVQNLKEQYEGIVNKIIAQIGDKVMQNQDADGIGQNGAQKTAKAFRCAEVGCVTPERQTTTTYVPSFQLPADQVAAAKAIAGTKYAGLITADGKVQIYQAVLNDFKAEFNKAKESFGLEYLGPALKPSALTMEDPKQFKKLDANNKQDNGIYAATMAAAAKKAQEALQTKFDVVDTPLLSILSTSEALPALPDGVVKADTYLDMSALTADVPCDSDKYVAANPTECASGSKQTVGPLLFAASPDGSTLQTQTLPTQPPTTQQGTGSNTATSVTSAIAAFALTAVAAIFLA